MAEKSKSEPAFSTPFMNEKVWQDYGFASWTDRIQAMGEAQARSIRHMTDQMLTSGRQFSDQVSNQMQVSAKLTKDSLDYGVNLMGTWNKIVLESTQSALDNLTPKG